MNSQLFNSYEYKTARRNKVFIEGTYFDLMSFRATFSQLYELHIDVFSDPYWEYYMEEYDEIHKTLTKRRDYYQPMYEFFQGNFSKYLVEYRHLKSKIISAMKNSNIPDYVNLNLDFKEIELRSDLIKEANKAKSNRNDLVEYKRIMDEIAELDSSRKERLPDLLEPTYPMATGIYNTSNSIFISIDIKSANFTMIKKYYPGVALATNTFQELVAKYTEIKFFVFSKKFRQIVHHSIDHNQLSAWEASETQRLYLEILKFNNQVTAKEKLNIRGVLGADEFFLQSSNLTLEKDLQKVKDIVSGLPDANIWRITWFELETIPVHMGYTMDPNINKITKTPVNPRLKLTYASEKVGKEYPLTQVRFLEILRRYVPQVVKWYKNEKIQEEDLAIQVDGYVFKMTQPFIAVPDLYSNVFRSNRRLTRK